jgi:hypothetical protein
MLSTLRYFGEYRDWRVVAFAGVLGAVIALAMMEIIDAHSMAAVIGAFGICLVGAASAWRIRQELSAITQGQLDFTNTPYVKAYREEVRSNNGGGRNKNFRQRNGGSRDNRGNSGRDGRDNRGGGRDNRNNKFKKRF